MGQAKQRGTFEEWKAKAIERDKLFLEQHPEIIQHIRNKAIQKVVALNIIEQMLQMAFK